MRIDVDKRFTKDCRELDRHPCTFIMGLPGETRRNRPDDRLRQEVNPHTLQVSLAAPYPGTHLYKQALENGWLDDANAELVDENGVQMAPLHTRASATPRFSIRSRPSTGSFYLRPAKIASIVGEMVMSPDTMNGACARGRSSSASCASGGRQRTELYAESKPNRNLAKSSQASAKPEQRKSKEKALISLDSLVGIEPFQWVAPTPRPENFFSFPFFSGP